MSGTVAVSNTFANQSGPIPLSQLDTNFSALVDYANDPTNRNNYAADTGVASTYTIALSPAVAGYTAGLMITFKPGNSNTSSSSINVNALGAKAIVNGAGANVSSGEIVAGRPLTVVYDGTAFVTPTGLASASSGAAKAWAAWVGTSTGTITANAAFNVATIVRTGTGSYNITLTTPMSSTSWVGIASCVSGFGAGILPNSASTALLITFATTTSTVADTGYVSFVAYG